MKVLFDQGVPVPLRGRLPAHAIDTAFERGWSALSNGDLLDQAEQDGYEVLITTDQNLKHQQNLSGRTIAVIVLLSTAWPRLEPRVADIALAIDGGSHGRYVEIPV